MIVINMLVTHRIKNIVGNVYAELEKIYRVCQIHGKLSGIYYRISEKEIKILWHGLFTTVLKIE